MNPPTASRDQRLELIDLYDASMPDVYGYLVSRCGSTEVAEDLTSETFLAAVDAVRQGKVPELTVAWLIGVARHKLVDHWRRTGRERDAAAALDGTGAVPSAGTTDGSTRADEWVDEWDVHVDQLVARSTLAALGPHHRSALTLRYLDGLPVREVAAHLGRTEGATEVLLVRAKAAFRARYEQPVASTADDATVNEPRTTRKGTTS